MHHHEETFVIDNPFTNAHKDAAAPGLFSDQAPSEANDDAQHKIERGGFAVSVGVRSEAVAASLPLFDLRPEDAQLLSFIPLVRTAWAEGNVTRSERRIVTTAARLRGIRPDDKAYDRVIEWLDAKPSDDFFGRPFRALKTTFGVPPPGSREVDEWDLLSFCEHVAAASNINSDFSDFRSRVCDEERALLDSFAARLGGEHPNQALDA